MEKRIFLAVVISIAVLALWSAVVPRMFPELARKPEPARPAAQARPAAGGAATSQKPAGTPPVVADAPAAIAAAAVTIPVSAQHAELTAIETPEYRAVFSNRGAQLVSFQLKSYTRKRSVERVDLVKGRALGRTDYPFAIEASDAAVASTLNNALYSVSQREEKGVRVLEFRYADGRLAATKTFRFPAQEYLFDFETSVTPPLPYRVMIGPGITTLGPEEEDTKVIITGNGVAQQNGKLRIVRRDKANGILAYDDVDFVGVEDNYFMTVLRPARANGGVLRRMAFFDAGKVRRDDLYAGLNATASGTLSGEAFFGPKETALLDRYGMGEALQFGWFGLIARFFLRALVWINQFTGNYGWAIIVLTILIKMALYPLQHKSIVSMKKMQKAQPKVEAIKAKYKKAKGDADQRQKMNVEMMQLYQKEGINPMAGCLPLVLQLPILWGFYNLLSRAIELRGAPWALWIHDLSEKDPYYITPILMTATMFIQTWITPSTGDPAQRRMFLIMPLVFGFLFKDFPSGLVLYWLVQNILTIAQQMIMNKWWKDHPSEIQNA